jgi:hypothetical protein
MGKALGQISKNKQKGRKKEIINQPVNYLVST